MAETAIRARQILIGALFAVLAACSASFTNHGYVPSEDDLSVLKVGRSDREAVAEAVGQPLSVGVLKDSDWYYISSRVKHYTYNADEVISREMVAISFDKRGLVSNIERYSLADGRVVALNRRVTTTGIKDMTFFRQLLSNIGRFDASTL